MSVEISKEKINSMLEILEDALGNEGEKNQFEENAFVENSKTMSKFMRNLSSCGNDDFTIQVAQIIHKTMIILQNLYICVESSELEGADLSELEGMDQKYKKRLIDIMETKKEKKYCETIKKEIDKFYVDFNKDLEPFQLNSDKLDKTCGYIDSKGQFQTFRHIIEDLSLESKKIMDDYYVLYNGLVFYAYLGGLPINKNLYVVVHSIFNFCGSMACKLTTAQMASTFTRFVRYFSDIDFPIEENFVMLESLISYICKTNDLYSKTYSKLKRGNFEFGDFMQITKNIDDILKKRDEYLKVDETTKEKLFPDMLVEKVEKQIVKRLPLPPSLQAKAKEYMGDPYYQSVFFALSSVTDKKGVSQFSKFIKYYNPLMSTKQTALHKRLMERDFQTIFYKKGKGNQSYFFKLNGRNAFIGLAWMLTTNAVKIDKFLGLELFEEKDR